MYSDIEARLRRVEEGVRLLTVVHLPNLVHGIGALQQAAVSFGAGGANFGSNSYATIAVQALAEGGTPFAGATVGIHGVDQYGVVTDLSGMTAADGTAYVQVVPGTYTTFVEGPVGPGPSYPYVGFTSGGQPYYPTTFTLAAGQTMSLVAPVYSVGTTLTLRHSSWGNFTLSATTGTPPGGWTGNKNVMIGGVNNNIIFTLFNNQALLLTQGFGFDINWGSPTSATLSPMNLSYSLGTDTVTITQP